MSTALQATIYRKSLRMPQAHKGNVVTLISADATCPEMILNKCFWIWLSPLMVMSTPLANRFRFSAVSEKVV